MPINYNLPQILSNIYTIYFANSCEVGVWRDERNILFRAYETLQWFKVKPGIV